MVITLLTSHWHLVYAKENSYTTRTTWRKNKNTPKKGLESYQYVGLCSLMEARKDVQAELPGIGTNLCFFYMFILPTKQWLKTMLAAASVTASFSHCYA